MDDGIGWGFLICFAIGCFVGAGATSAGVNNRWERMLVDNPAQISAITTRVLAERAEQAAK